MKNHSPTGNIDKPTGLSKNHVGINSYNCKRESFFL